MPLKYLWHFGVSKWEKVMTKIGDIPTNSIEKVHIKFLAERDKKKIKYKNENIHKKKV